MLNEIAPPAGAGDKVRWGCGGDAPTLMSIEESCFKLVSEKAVVPSLGITGKSVNPPLVVKAQGTDPLVKARRSRLHLQALAAELLGGVTVWRRPSKRHPVGGRVDAFPMLSLCGKKPARGWGEDVEVKRSPDGKAFFSGLIHCGSVWVCPVCSSSISEGRRVELVTGIEKWKARGYNVLHLTLTFPHYGYESPRLLLSNFSRARHLMMNRKRWKKFALRVALVGSVRALEVTVGDGTGWHVHTHELLFVESVLGEMEIASLAREILEMWQRACDDAGLPVPNEYGVKLQDGEYAAHYASKWGLENEMTKGHIKRSREGRYSPFDLLRAYDETRDEKFAKWFRVYALAFRGRRQLSWSEGLHALLGLGKEQTDEKQAASESEVELLGKLNPVEWEILSRTDAKFDFLQVVDVAGFLAGLRFIGALAKRIGWHYHAEEEPRETVKDSS